MEEQTSTIPENFENVNAKKICKGSKEYGKYKIDMIT